MNWKTPGIIIILFIIVTLIESTSLYAQYYETVKIGDQVWMERNLQNDVLGSICYDDDSLNCKEYGRLYCWQAALDACPEGFRLPTDKDWSILINSLGGPDSAASALLKGGSSGFDIPLSGNYQPEMKMFSFKNQKAYFWTASSYSMNTAWIRIFDKDSKSVTRTTIGKSFYFSIRCIRID